MSFPHLLAAVAINVVVEDFDISAFGGGLRWPEDGIRCAGRKGTTRLLWLHEFYIARIWEQKEENKSICIPVASIFVRFRVARGCCTRNG